MDGKLPSLRRRIFGAYALLVAVYAVALGALTLAATRMDSVMVQKIASRNYDSIRAAEHIRRDWMQRPASAVLRRDLTQTLAFARKNITKPGEADAVAAVERLWARRGAGEAVEAMDDAMQAALDGLVRV